MRCSAHGRYSYALWAQQLQVGDTSISLPGSFGSGAIGELLAMESNPPPAVGDKGFGAPFNNNLSDPQVRVDVSGVATGNDADARDMLRLGRSQELRRNFTSFSVLGLAMTTMSTWVAMLMTSLFSLINGGRAGTIWLYLATWICTFALAASLAELASMAPTSGGQYREQAYLPLLTAPLTSFLQTGCLNSLLASSKDSSVISSAGWRHWVGRL